MSSNKKKGLLLLTALFYAGMILLTVFAEDIHNARLPQVAAARMIQQIFTYERVSENGFVIEADKKALAIPKEIVQESCVFVIRMVEEKGRTCTRVYRVSVETGLETEKYYEVRSGLHSADQIVIAGYETLSDGEEVYVKEKNK